MLPGSDRWAIALLRPGAHPVAAFEQALAQATADVRLVIAVDQFEELFTACRDEAERAAFADALVAAVRDPRRRALVLIALRADFYGRCASYPELWRMLGANHIPVGPMRRDELRRAIVMPAQRAGLRVDDALVDALVADVQGEPGALPLLSTALLELWQERDGQRLAYPAYDRAGGVQGAVARLAERVYAELDPGEQARARAILVRLAGVGEGGVAVRRRAAARRARARGTRQARRRPARDRQRRGGGGRARGAAARVAAAARAGSRRTPRAGACITTSASPRANGTRAAATPASSTAAPGSPPPLTGRPRTTRSSTRSSARSWTRAAPRAGAPSAACVRCSRASPACSCSRSSPGSSRSSSAAPPARRRPPPTPSGWGRARSAENDLDRSLLLARQGVALDDSSQTRGNLLAALNKSPAAVGVLRGAGEGFTGLALSPDGRTLAAGDSAGSLFLFDTRTRRRVRAPSVHAGEWPIGMLAFSPDGRRLAIAHDTYDGEVVTVMDTRTRRLGRELRLYDYDRRVTGLSLEGTRSTWRAARGDRDDVRRPVAERLDTRSGRRILGPVTLGRSQSSPLLDTSDGRRVLTAADAQLVVRDADDAEVGRARRPGPHTGSVIALSPNDRTVALGGHDGSVRFLDLRSGRQRTASGRHSGPVTAARFTPDGRSLVTASEDGAAILWDVGAGAASETLQGHANGITALQISADGRTLYTAGVDGAIFIWDLAGTQRLGRPIDTGAPNGRSPR